MSTSLLFDLDGTLYPETAAMGAQVARLMIQFIASHFEIRLEEAVALRRENVVRFGTTLEWLRAERGFTAADTEQFLASVHPETETDQLTFDPHLRPFLLSLNMPMAVLTNSPMEHAVRVLDFLQIRDLFPVVVDIRENNFRGKPHPHSYQVALEKARFLLAETFFIDDQPKYTDGYARFGGSPILIDECSRHNSVSYPRLKSIYELPALLNT